MLDCWFKDWSGALALARVLQCIFILHDRQNLACGEQFKMRFALLYRLDGRKQTFRVYSHLGEKRTVSIWAKGMVQGVHRPLVTWTPGYNSRGYVA